MIRADCGLGIERNSASGHHGRDTKCVWVAQATVLIEYTKPSSGILSRGAA